MSSSKNAVLSILAVIFALVVAGLYLYALWPVRERHPAGFYAMLGAGLLGGFMAYRYFTSRNRRRRAILSKPFPEQWRSVLEKYVDFYQRLSIAERRRFEREVQLFLGEKRVTGINTDIDDQTRVLVAASAVIPIFGFPDWDYPGLEEVLVYPGAFTRDFLQSGKGRDVLGMVGEGAMNRVMILSKPALLNGFLHHHDGHNTGVHEFIHLIDAADGAYDGVPALLDHRYAEPWLDLLHREMEKVRHGKSDLRAYAGTNKEEFFAVAGEYFFEKPGQLRSAHPELYEMMKRAFRQDTLRLLENKLPPR